MIPLGLALLSSQSDIVYIKPMFEDKNIISLLANKSSELPSGLLRGGVVAFLTADGKVAKRVSIKKLEIPLYISEEGRVVCRIETPVLSERDKEYTFEPADYYFTGGRSYGSRTIKAIYVGMRMFSVPYFSSASAVAVNETHDKIFLLNTMLKRPSIFLASLDYPNWNVEEINFATPVFASQSINTAAWISEDEVVISLFGSEVIQDRFSRTLPVIQSLDTKASVRTVWNYISIINLSERSVKAIARYKSPESEMEAIAGGGMLAVTPSFKSVYLLLNHKVFSLPLHSAK